MKKRIKEYIMDTKLFWRLYFWWGIRQARKRRLAWEAHQKTLPQLDTEQYWESVHRKRQTKE
jgi:hypothetical protein